MNLKGNLTSKGLQGSIGKSRMQGILGTNPAAIPISVDNALSLSSTNPVQNKVITAAITNRLLSDDVKNALLQIAQKVAYIDADGQDYYDALYDALYPPVGLDSIGAVFDSSATIYNTMTLDDLKQYLVVTAFYSDGTSETVTTYTLSGSMDAGTQTITVAYGGETTTFTVTVAEWLVSIDAVFTQGSAVIYDTDSLDTLRQYLVVTATYSDSTTAAVSDYALSGTLTAGTSVITVSYSEKTTTFNVTVTHYSPYTLLYNWDLTSSLTDTVSQKVATPTSDFNVQSDGMHFDGSKRCIMLPDVYAYNRRFEIDIASTNANMTGNGGDKGSVYGFGNGCIAMFGNATSPTGSNSASTIWQFIWRGLYDEFSLYANNSWRDDFSSYFPDPNYFSGKTLWFQSNSSGKITIGVGNNSVVTPSQAHTSGTNMFIGKGDGNGQAFRDAIITAVRVYEVNT